VKLHTKFFEDHKMTRRKIENFGTSKVKQKTLKIHKSKAPPPFTPNKKKKKNPK
jgi:hypothetical protein